MGSAPSVFGRGRSGRVPRLKGSQHLSVSPISLSAEKPSGFRGNTRGGRLISAIRNRQSTPNGSPSHREKYCIIARALPASQTFAGINPFEIQEGPTADPSSTVGGGHEARHTIGRHEAMADWKESIQGRIENQSVRLNLGLPNNDPHLSEEVQQFAEECRLMVGGARR